MSILVVSATIVQPMAARSENWTKVLQPSTEEKKLLWSTLRNSDDNKVETSLRWSSVPKIADKKEQTNVLTKALIWRPLHPKEVISNEDIIPLSDLEEVRFTPLDQPTAYSRGSMIQIGETLYPNLGFNALQRHPNSWINAAVVAIDDSSSDQIADW